ncbi:MAG: hypothetical protein JXJ19_03735 [Elusimicrobia bacterium]|nr:hypothetical protein [Elusimicrobiota bacterium]
MGSIEDKILRVLEKSRYCGIMINPQDIDVSEKIRENCRACKWYKNRYSCPPYSWPAEKTREVIEKSSGGFLLVRRVRDVPLKLIKKNRLLGLMLRNFFYVKYTRGLQKLVFSLEKTAEKSGYKVNGFIAGACAMHIRCGAPRGRPCRSPALCRSSLEACGMDVDRLAGLYGIEDYKKYPDNSFHWIGLILVSGPS